MPRASPKQCQINALLLNFGLWVEKNFWRQIWHQVSQVPKFGVWFLLVYVLTFSFNDYNYCCQIIINKTNWTYGIWNIGCKPNLDLHCCYISNFPFTFNRGLDNYLSVKQVTQYISDEPWGWYKSPSKLWKLFLE